MWSAFLATGQDHCQPALRKALAEADGIVIRSGTTLTAEILEGQSRLKAIVRAGVGVDEAIDVAAATRRDRGDEYAEELDGLGVVSLALVTGHRRAASPGQRTA